MKIKIGTRKSILAVRQAEEVRDLILNNEPMITASDIEIIAMSTSGDNLAKEKISELGGKGLFTKEIEEKLLIGEIDIAVHSMKDMPAISPKNLLIGAITKREDARDCFISKKYKSINDLPKGAVVGTSALRRKAILLKNRPDLKIVDYRGNVHTRLKKLDEENVDAIILATAGLNRVGLEENITEILSSSFMLPAIGQGALAVQYNENNRKVKNILEKINHIETELAIKSERQFMLSVGGDCNTPIACFAEIIGSDVKIRAEILSVDGKDSFFEEELVPINKNIEIAKNIAKRILAKIKNKRPELLSLLKVGSELS